MCSVTHEALLSCQSVLDLVWTDQDDGTTLDGLLGRSPILDAMAALCSQECRLEDMVDASNGMYQVHSAYDNGLDRHEQQVARCSESRCTLELIKCGPKCKKQPVLARILAAQQDPSRIYDAFPDTEVIAFETCALQECFQAKCKDDSTRLQSFLKQHPSFVSPMTSEGLATCSDISVCQFGEIIPRFNMFCAKSCAACLDLGVTKQCADLDSELWVDEHHFKLRNVTDTYGIETCKEVLAIAGDQTCVPSTDGDGTFMSSASIYSHMCAESCATHSVPHLHLGSSNPCEDSLWKATQSQLSMVCNLDGPCSCHGRTVTCNGDINTVWGMDFPQTANSFSVKDANIPTLRVPVINEGSAPNPSAGLISITMTRCKLERIASLSFSQSQASLSILQLRHNNIRTIDQQAFVQIPQLVLLDLTDNALEELPSWSFHGLSNLRTLCLDQNRLTSVSGKLLEHLTSLHILTMNRNRLDQIPSNFFSTTSLLNVFGARSNALFSLAGTAFSALTALISLDLAANKFTMVLWTEFAPLRALKDLDLTANNIEGIERQTTRFNSTTTPLKLEHLLMNGNPSQCSLIWTTNGRQLRCQCSNSYYGDGQYCEETTHQRMQRMDGQCDSLLAGISCSTSCNVPLHEGEGKVFCSADGRWVQRDISLPDPDLTPLSTAVVGDEYLMPVPTPLNGTQTTVTVVRNPLASSLIQSMVSSSDYFSECITASFVEDGTLEQVAGGSPGVSYVRMLFTRKVECHHDNYGELAGSIQISGIPLRMEISVSSGRHIYMQPIRLYPGDTPAPRPMSYGTDCKSKVVVLAPGATIYCELSGSDIFVRNGGRTGSFTTVSKLPNGLKLNERNGALYGTIEKLEDNQDQLELYSVHVVAIDSRKQMHGRIQAVEITVVPVEKVVDTAVVGTVGEFFESGIPLFRLNYGYKTTQGSTEPSSKELSGTEGHVIAQIGLGVKNSFRVIEPLPDGLVLNPSTGLLYGIPATPTIDPAKITVLRSLTFDNMPVLDRPNLTSHTLFLTILPETVISWRFSADATLQWLNFVPGNALPTGTLLAQYQGIKPASRFLTIPAKGHPGRTFTPQFNSNTLPQGLRLHPLTGEILGTPTEAGVFNVVIGATLAAYNNSTVAAENVTMSRSFQLSIQGCNVDSCSSRGECVHAGTSKRAHCKCESGYLGELCNDEARTETARSGEKETRKLKVAVYVLSAVLILLFIGILASYTYRHRFAKTPTKNDRDTVVTNIRLTAPPTTDLPTTSRNDVATTLEDTASVSKRLHAREDNVEATEDDAREPFPTLQAGSIIIGPKLGEGSFGYLYKAFHSNGGSEPNRIVTAHVFKAAVSKGDSVIIAKLQAEALNARRHPNIVDFVAIYPHPGSTDLAPIIVLEYCNNGLLHQYLSCFTGARVLTLGCKLKMAHDVACGMAFLTGLNLGGTLAGQTVLVGSNFECKISTLGFKGNVRWTAVDVLEGGSPTIASDVWSFGVIMVEIFTNRKAQSGYRLERPSRCPEGFYGSVMSRCWAVDPAARPSFQNLAGFIGDLCGMLEKEVNGYDREVDVEVGWYGARFRTEICTR
jgi:Leucine-rich repeat (LRR) protein